MRVSEGGQDVQSVGSGKRARDLSMTHFVGGLTIGKRVSALRHGGRPSWIQCAHTPGAFAGPVLV